VADPLDEPAPAPIPEPPAGEGLAEVLVAAAVVDDVAAVPGNVTAPYGFARAAPATPPVAAAV